MGYGGGKALSETSITRLRLWCPGEGWADGGGLSGGGVGRKPLEEEDCVWYRLCHRVKFPNEVARVAGSFPGPVSGPGYLLEL